MRISDWSSDVCSSDLALGADHPMMANLYANLGAIFYRLNRPNDAMPMIRRAFELTEQATGGPNQNSAAMRVQYAQAMTRAGQYEDAIAFLDAATPIIRSEEHTSELQSPMRISNAV